MENKTCLKPPTSHCIVLYFHYIPIIFLVYFDYIPSGYLTYQVAMENGPFIDGLPGFTY